MSHFKKQQDSVFFTATGGEKTVDTTHRRSLKTTDEDSYFRNRSSILNRTYNVEISPNMIVKNYKPNFCQPTLTKRQFHQQQFEMQIKNSQDPRTSALINFQSRQMAKQDIRKLIPRRPEQLNEIGKMFRQRFTNLEGKDDYLSQFESVRSKSVVEQTIKEEKYQIEIEQARMKREMQKQFHE